MRTCLPTSGCSTVLHQKCSTALQPFNFRVPGHLIIVQEIEFQQITSSTCFPCCRNSPFFTIIKSPRALKLKSGQPCATLQHPMFSAIFLLASFFTASHSLPSMFLCSFFEALCLANSPFLFNLLVKHLFSNKSLQLK